MECGCMCALCWQETNAGEFAENDSHVANVVLNDDETEVLIATNK